MPGHARNVIAALERYARLRIHADDLAICGHAERTRQLHHDDHRELQALGLVNGHDAHHVVVFAQLAGGSGVARAAGNIRHLKKIMQRSARALGLSTLAQQAQIRLTRRALFHRAAQRI